MQTQQRYRQLQQQLLGGVIILVMILLMGTLVYAELEHWSLLDAAYMTVITLSTVGFSETHSLSPAGRLFTIALIFTGIANIGFLINRFTEAITQRYFQEGLRLQQQARLIDKLDRHYIICGFGRTGYQVALEFTSEQIPFLVIDTEEQRIAEALDCGYPAIAADATLDSTLMQAGIERSVCVVVTLPSDAENLYILLSAKTLNPNLRIIARANSEEGIQKLQRAGADTVISPYVTGAKRMAAAALRPQVIDFLDGILTGSDRSFFLEEFQVQPETCPYVDQDLEISTLQSTSGAMILAIGCKDGSLVTSPSGVIRLRAGDTLICLGSPDQLRRLNQYLIPLLSSDWSKIIPAGNSPP